MQIEEQLDAGPNTPRRARALIAPLRSRLDKATYQDARLLVSEAATNAVVHGAPGSPVSFHAALDHDVLRVELRNRSGRHRPRVASRATGEGGLGLQLLDTLADSWGTEHNDHTVVWFELSLAPVHAGG